MPAQRLCSPAEPDRVADEHRAHTPSLSHVARAQVRDLVKSWITSWTANFAGAALMAWMCFHAKTMAAGPFLAVAKGMAVAKCSIPLFSVFMKVRAPRIHAHPKGARAPGRAGDVFSGAVLTRAISLNFVPAHCVRAYWRPSSPRTHSQGVLCNYLVCLGVWGAMSSTDVGGKVRVRCLDA